MAADNGQNDEKRAALRAMDRVRAGKDVGMELLERLFHGAACSREVTGAARLEAVHRYGTTQDEETAPPKLPVRRVR